MSAKEGIAPAATVLCMPPDGPSFGVKLPGWSVYAFSIVGVSHSGDAKPSDDACTLLEVGEWLIGIVSDGAGSAKFGGLGGRMVAEHVGAALARRVAGGEMQPKLDESESADWRTVIEEAIEYARAAIIRLSVPDFNSDTHETQTKLLREYHATLVGFVSNGAAGLFFHVGDGLGIAFKNALATDQSSTIPPHQLSLPENGEYANETFFITMQNWREHLRLTFFGPASSIVLMSDGISNLVLTRHDTLFDRTIVPIMNYLPTVTPDLAAQALLNTFTNAEANIVSGDDKTLIWLSRLTTG
jgi:hypothetical protein